MINKMKLHYWSDYMYSNGSFNYNKISKIVVYIRSIQMAYYNNLQTKIVSNYWLSKPTVSITNLYPYTLVYICCYSERGKIALCYRINVAINCRGFCLVNKKYEFR